SSTDIKGYNEWVNKTWIGVYGRWVKFDDISTEDIQGYVRGYELKVRIKTGGSWQWVAPNSIYDKCGEEAAHPASHFIDGSTSSYWEHAYGSTHHWIIVELDDDYEIGGVSVYVADRDANNWTCNVKVGRYAGWMVEGQSPYLNGTDYPNNYVWAASNGAEIGNWTFYNTTFVTVLDVKLVVNYSSYYSVEVWFWNASTKISNCWQEASSKLPSTSGAWTVKNVTLSRFLWSPYFLNRIKIKFKTTTATSTSKSQIDYAYLWVKGYKNQSRMLQWLFDMLIFRRVNDTFPYTRSYLEASQTYSSKAGAGLLSGALLYRLEENMTFLNYAYEYANWLQNKPVCRLFQTYDLDKEQWNEVIEPSYASIRLLELCVLTGINSSYTNLLASAAENFSDILVQKPEYRMAKAYVNGTPTDDITYANWQAWGIAALSYASYVLANSTLEDIAIRMCLNWTLSDIDLPYGVLYLNGTLQTYGLKEDQHFGHYLLALEMNYYFTQNTTVKNRIKDVAWAGAQYFWNTSDNDPRFVYLVNASSGEQIDTGSVHGFGYIDEALIQAYLIWGNETWLTRARKDFESQVIKERLLTVDLINHYRDGGQTMQDGSGSDINDYWNAPAKRVALILYNLNYSLTHGNITYLTYYNRLYAATSYGHYIKANLGWAGVVWATSLNPTYSGADVDLATIFRNFMNKTGLTIDTFPQLYAEFGNAFTGEIGASKPLLLTKGTNYTNLNTPCKFYAKWRDIDGLSTAKFYWNASGSMQQNGSLSLSGTEAWSNFTRTVPQNVQVIAWYIVANDTAGNWGNTTVQYLQLSQFYTEVFWEEVGVDDVPSGHGAVILNENVLSLGSLTKFVGKLCVEAVLFGESISRYVKINIQSSLSFLASTFKIPGIIQTETVGFQSQAGKSATLTVTEAVALPDFAFKDVAKYFHEALAFLSQPASHTTVMPAEAVGLNSQAGKSAVLTVTETLVMPDTPLKSLVKPIWETLSFQDQPFSNIYLLIQEQITDHLTITDKPFKVVTVVRRETLFPADYILKHISKTFTSAITFFDSTYTQITITVQEQIIPEHLWLQDSVTQLIIICKVEAVNLQEAILKSIQILKVETVSFLDTLTKHVGPFIHETLQTETVKLKDVVLVETFTPWYNNPVSFITVCLFAFCLGLFAYYIYQHL
ncbi:MAG: hypothetical protein DRN81_04840, partial [Thermoproteota archaeon]